MTPAANQSDPTAGADPRSAIAGQSLSDIPRRSAHRWPDRVALIHRDTVLTFADLDARIDAAAAYLWARGIRPGDRVMLQCHNCWQFPVVIFAAARIGAVGVPINFSLTDREVAFLIDDSTPAALIVEDALYDVAIRAVAVAGHRPTVLATITLGGGTSPDWEDFTDSLTLPQPPAPDIVVPDDAPIRIMYTSGTESQPKGVIHSSRTLMWQYMSCIVSGGMAEQDIEVHSMPLYHCAQLDNFLITDLMLGAKSILLDRAHPEAILTAVSKYRATKLFCPPTVWVAISQALADGAWEVDSLAKGYYGASALPTEVLTELRSRLPKLLLWNFYGQTEMGSLATVLGPDQQDLRPGSAGRPALHVRTWIVDEDNHPLASGQVGEIVHQSPQVTLGYHGQPAATRESLLGGWFHSGDLGYFDDEGYLWVVDRKKDMIKTGGENVSSREVEEVLYRIPGVQEAAVYGVPDRKWVEAVAATIVVGPGSQLSAAEITKACRESLAPFKIPKSIRFTDALPKNPSGKILKRNLRGADNTEVQ